MNLDLLTMALIAGAATWCFRALPTLLMRREPAPGSVMSRFLGATGPAAIATLFVASLMPELDPARASQIPLVAGVAATVLAFLPGRSVVIATLAGAIGYGLAFWLVS